MSSDNQLQLIITKREYQDGKTDYYWKIVQGILWCDGGATKTYDKAYDKGMKSLINLTRNKRYTKQSTIITEDDLTDEDLGL